MAAVEIFTIHCSDSSGVLSNWVMDSRYFSKRVSLGSGHFISFIFLDTSPCVAAYRADDQYLSYGRLGQTSQAVGHNPPWMEAGLLRGT